MKNLFGMQFKFEINIWLDSKSRSARVIKLLVEKWIKSEISRIISNDVGFLPWSKESEEIAENQRRFSNFLARKGASLKARLSRVSNKCVSYFLQRHAYVHVGVRVSKDSRLFVWPL